MRTIKKQMNGMNKTDAALFCWGSDGFILELYPRVIDATAVI
jgi:hypothetical protein